MTWTKGWRERVWSQLDQPWDMIIIGGGITGAGILRQATLAGLRALLVEAHDFASGTSSRSSKLVHGGMRYLKNAQFKLTLESVSEREYLLRQGRGLVNRLGFLYASLRGDKMPGFIFGAGLTLYDLMAGQPVLTGRSGWSHRAYDTLDMRELCPPLTAPALTGGYRYFDAQTDDARLVLRLLRESVTAGGLALNYARVERLLKTRNGQICGVVLKDTSGEMEKDVEIRGRIVVNATGAWTDALRVALGQTPRMRPLRGSHLVLPLSRLPLTRAVTFLHPQDGRPVFALPWEGVVVFGTTDVDHKTELATDPSISAEEFEYLLTALQHVFPLQELSEADIMATFSGLRPVVDTGKADPSKESREHAIWEENGLLTVAGGKLTTFRIMARDALQAARRQLGQIRFDPNLPILNPTPASIDILTDETLHSSQRLRLLGRYGAEALALLAPQNRPELTPVGSTPYLLAELRHAARAEGVVHLDDLLLRRVRLGLLLPNGGMDLLETIRPIIQPELGWDDARWESELVSYHRLWEQSYSFYPLPNKINSRCGSPRYSAPVSVTSTSSSRPT